MSRRAMIASASTALQFEKNKKQKTLAIKCVICLAIHRAHRNEHYVLNENVGCTVIGSCNIA